MKKTEVIMPQLKPDATEAVLCAWLKNPGEHVEFGEPIFEVETDKVVTQVEATASGILTKQFAEDGDTVPVMAKVAEISED